MRRTAARYRIIVIFATSTESGYSDTNEATSELKWRVKQQAKLLLARILARNGYLRRMDRVHI
jgi:hypothetical protein